MKALPIGSQAVDGPTRYWLNIRKSSRALGHEDSSSDVAAEAIYSLAEQTTSEVR